MNDKEYGHYVPQQPLSELLTVDSGTNKFKRSRAHPKRTGLKAGLAQASALKHITPVKIRPKHLKNDVSVGVEADSQAELAWEEGIYNPDEFGMDGQEKHFAQLLYQEYVAEGENESNFF